MFILDHPRAAMACCCCGLLELIKQAELLKLPTVFFYSSCPIWRQRGLENECFIRPRQHSHTASSRHNNSAIDCSLASRFKGLLTGQISVDRLTYKLTFKCHLCGTGFLRCVLLRLKLSYEYQNCTCWYADLSLMVISAIHTVVLKLCTWGKLCLKQKWSLLHAILTLKINNFSCIILSWERRNIKSTTTVWYINVTTIYHPEIHVCGCT